MTDPEDALAVVEYLKTKATGATIGDAKATLESRVLDGRKISAYESWGLVQKDEERLRLTELGRRLARGNADEKVGIFGEIVQRLRAYRVAAEWMHHQGHDTVPVSDLAAHWFEHLRSELGTTTEKTIRNQAACFLNLAQAAGLGDYFVGRRGQPTRLEIDRDALGQFVAGVELAGDTIDSNGLVDAASEVTELEGNETEERGVRDEYTAEEDEPSERLARGKEKDTEPLRIFISHGRNAEIVDQVKTMLELGDLDYEVVVEQESTAIPVPEKVFEAMRRCDAAVMCVTADDEGERDDGTFEINANVLIEVGAAFLLYDKRVVLVWDRRIAVPSNLQGLYRCEFEGTELSWSAGMKLMKAVAQFKRAV